MIYTPGTIAEAFNSKTVAGFLTALFPYEWFGVIARIIETGAEFEQGADWAPQWGRIPLTVKTGPSNLEAQVKACIYRAHDCLHQLWGLPIPSPEYTEDDFYHYKRVQICGEVTVLTLVEFMLGKHLYDYGTDDIKAIICNRNAVPLILPGGPLAGKTPIQVVQRMDELMHKKIRPQWVRDSEHATALCDDYVPMIQYDRDVVDANWERMKAANWRPQGIPHTKFNPDMSGLELTTWMMTDFYHLLATSSEIDTALAEFNKARRANVTFPPNWNNVIKD